MPVRCGSKSIPFKNIRFFCGKPLLYWNLQELEYTPQVSEVIVATDCTEIADVVMELGLSKVSLYMRSVENATDTASTESVMLEYLRKHPPVDEDELFMLVQATSPFTQREHFSGAIKQYIIGKYDSLVTCARSKRFLWSEEGISLNYNYMARPRRQDFDGFLVENGAFYISRSQRILETRCRLNGRILPFEMPEYSLTEIDEEDDWALAEHLMKKYFNYLKLL